MSGGARSLATLIRSDAEVREARLELLQRAFLEPGLVGVLNPQQVDTAAVPGDVEVDAGGEDPADVQPARRAWREPGDLSRRGQSPRRVPLLQLRRLWQVGGEQRVNQVTAQLGHAAKAIAPPPP